MAVGGDVVASAQARQIIFLPGEVSIDIVEAVNKGLDRLGKVSLRISNSVARKRPALQSVSPLRYRNPLRETPKQKAARIRHELLDAGVTAYGLLKSESRCLPKILHDNEHIEAAIYGQHGPNSAMLIATSERIVYLDKKPMVELFDEVSYDVISGVEFDVHTLFATVILHTPVKNYDFRFVNLHCAEKFARHIERQRLEHENKREQPSYVPAHTMAKNDMAGYSWLPTEEDERQRVQQVLGSR